MIKMQFLFFLYKICMKKLLEFDYMHTNKTYICIFCIWNLFDLSVFFLKEKQVFLILG